MPDFIESITDPAKREWVEERAAMLEHDALMYRKLAEAKAYIMMMQYFYDRSKGKYRGKPS